MMTTLTPEGTVYLCAVISCVFLWLFGGLIVFHWFLRRSIDRWVTRLYEAFAVDDDAEKRRAWVAEKSRELWARVVNRRVG